MEACFHHGTYPVFFFLAIVREKAELTMYYVNLQLQVYNYFFLRIVREKSHSYSIYSLCFFLNPTAETGFYISVIMSILFFEILCQLFCKLFRKPLTWYVTK